MMADPVSEQLLGELQASTQSAFESRRPIIHHLNADTSWFLQIPRPASAIRRGGRAYFNILIDPWLAGGQSDVASWFSQQFHAIPSAVPSIAAVEELAKASELLASGKPASDIDDEESGTLIDAVAISHEFTDHCSKHTLLDIDPNVPVYAIKEAAKLIQGWSHFRTVVPVSVFTPNSPDWRSTSISPLPDWIGISRLLQTDDVLNYHAALLFTFNNGHADLLATQTPTSPPRGRPRKRGQHHAPIEPNEDLEAAEAIIYTPHGMHACDLEFIPRAQPPLHTLAFLHGLHNVRVGTVSGRTALQSNLGAHNGLKAQRVLGARYWIGTHDEIKTGGGLVSYFLQRDVISVGDALALEAKKRAEKGSGTNIELDEVLESFEGTNWVDLGNGESQVLV